MNNLKSGGTLFLAYEGRMGRASVAMSNLGNFWRTDKSWVSKSIRILPGIRFWGQKSSQTMLRVWKWRFTQVWYFPLYPPLVNQPPRARGVEDLQRLFLCVKPSSYMYRQTYQKQGLILESYRILRWTSVIVCVSIITAKLHKMNYEH